MPPQLPALSLAAVPGRRRKTLEIAREMERRGFPAIFAPSLFSNMSLCEALAWNTERVTFATSIAPIYSRTVDDFAQSAAFLHEVSNGRFLLGIGVSHAPSHVRMGVTPGKPLGDIRAFVQKLRGYQGIGDLPPIIIATLRKNMIALAGEIGDGMVFANGSRSHMPASLANLPAAKRNATDFFIGNMIPTCISDDIEAAKAFYAEVMGLKVQRDHPVFVQFDRFALTSDESFSGSALELYWAVDDIEAAHREFSQATSTSEIQEQAFGRLFSVSDPDEQPRFLIEFAKERPSQAVETGPHPNPSPDVRERGSCC